MALHSDQSPHAQKGAHSAQQGKCSWCKEEYGWWQGVINMDTKGATQWICLVCGALHLPAIPPPENFIRLQVHHGVLEHWSIDLGIKPITLTRTCTEAMPLMLAWSLENGSIDPKELRRGVFAYTERQGTGTVPMLVKRPSWLRTNGEFAPAAYADSDEDRIFHSIFWEALGTKDWTRTGFIGGDPRDFFKDIGRWSDLLPDGHPYRNDGLEVALVVPWQGIVATSPGPIEGQVFTAPLIEGVEAAVDAVIRERIRDASEPALLPSLWSAAGLTR